VIGMPIIVAAVPPRVSSASGLPDQDCFGAQNSMAFFAAAVFRWTWLRREHREVFAMPNTQRKTLHGRGD
jgi:hypothetical protein